MRPLSELSADEKRELLKKLLAERHPPEQNEYPLSYGQQALWFLQQLAPSMASYNVAITAAATPEFNLPAVEASLQYVMERHPSLRTVVAAGSSGPVQKVMPAAHASIHVFERAVITREEVHADYARPFNLATDLPFRASVYRSREKDVLLLVAHHVAFDAWSAQLLFEDLSVAYASALQGATPALAPITVSYAQFVNWQRQLTSNAQGEGLHSYWSQQLSGELPILQIGAARAGQRGTSGGSVPVALDADVLERLRQIGREGKATLFALVLLAWSLLLNRLTGCDEIIVGTPVSGRSRPEWTGIIGYFVNLLPMRVCVDKRRSFLAQLPPVVETVLGGLDHQDWPFPLMVDRLRVRRDSTSSPVFQTIVNVQRVQPESTLARLFGTHPGPPATFGASRLEPFLIPQQEGQFDIGLELAESRTTAVGHIKFNHDVLTRRRAEHIAAQFDKLLRAIASQPGIPVEALASGSDERDELLF
jgi:hypothetical protein